VINEWAFLNYWGGDVPGLSTPKSTPMAITPVWLGKSFMFSFVSADTDISMAWELIN